MPAPKPSFKQILGKWLGLWLLLLGLLMPLLAYLYIQINPAVGHNGFADLALVIYALLAMVLFVLASFIVSVVSLVRRKDMSVAGFCALLGLLLLGFLVKMLFFPQ